MVDFVVLDGCSGTRYRTFGANVPQNEGHVYLLPGEKYTPSLKSLITTTPNLSFLQNSSGNL